MSQQLRKLGCIVHTADHGQDCLDFLQTTIFTSNSENVPLSIILMDLEVRFLPIADLYLSLLTISQMPVMDGLTCVRRIREHEATGHILSHVPVIAITANARSEQINIAMEAGMDTVVTKPFRIPDLVPRMQSLLSEYPAK
jgi:CheY-like chemotaxis protein